MMIHEWSNRIPYKPASNGETDSIALELVGTGQADQHTLHKEALERQNPGIRSNLRLAIEERHQLYQGHTTHFP
jgi:hypothetical protein